MNYQQALETQETFDKVCDILFREFGALPKEAEDQIIAGGAIASAVFEALNIDGINIKRYKDLDLFINCRSEYDANIKSWSAKYRHHGVKAGYDLSFDTATVEPLIKKTLIVFGSAMGPNNINHVYINYGLTKDKTAELLSTFDINTCQVAICLETRKLRYTDAFVNFLYQQKVEVVSLHTSNHTAVRYLEKVKQFGHAPCESTLSSIADMCHLIDRLRSHIKMHGRRHEPKHLPGYLFSFYYKTRWNKHKLELSKAGLKTTPVCITKRNLYRKRGSYCFYEVKPRRSASSKADEVWELLLKYPNPDVGNLITLSPLLLNDKLRETCLNPEPDVDPIFYLDHLVNHPQVNLKSLNVKTKMELIDLYARHNTHTITHLVEQCRNANQLASAIKNIAWLNNHYPSAFGLVEEMLRNRFMDAGTWVKSIPANIANRAAVKALADKELNYRKTLLASHVIEPKHTDILATLNAEIRPMTVIKEVISELDLMELGARQKHCVGGYFNYIESGDGSIFELRDKNGYTSTLQVHLKQKQKPAYIVQHRTTKNETPKKEHLSIANKLIGLITDRDNCSKSGFC